MGSKKEKEGESSPVLVVAASRGSVGEGISVGGSLLCLWAENSSHLWMVHNSVIEKIKSEAVKMVLKKMEGESSPALVVAASLDIGGEIVRGGGLLLCLWTKNSSHPWMMSSNVIEKIKSAAAKMESKKEKEGESSPAFVVTAFLDSGGDSGGGGSSLLCPWVENSSHL